MTFKINIKSHLWCLRIVGGGGPLGGGRENLNFGTPQHFRGGVKKRCRRVGPTCTNYDFICNIHGVMSVLMYLPISAVGHFGSHFGGDL
jgi:hypothetical protein